MQCANSPAEQQMQKSYCRRLVRGLQKDPWSCVTCCRCAARSQRPTDHRPVQGGSQQPTYASFCSLICRTVASGGSHLSCMLKCCRVGIGTLCLRTVRALNQAPARPPTLSSSTSSLFALNCCRT